LKLQQIQSKQLVTLFSTKHFGLKDRNWVEHKNVTKYHTPTKAPIILSY